MLNLISRTLTNAQILALPTTRIQLHPAPAAGFRVKPIHFSFRFKVDGADYTNINTTYADLRIETDSGKWLANAIANDNSLSVPLTQLTDILQASPSNRLVDIPAGFLFGLSGGATSGSEEYIKPLGTTDYVDMDADAIFVAVDNNGSGNFTGGHANNTLKVSMYFVLEDLS